MKAVVIEKPNHMTVSRIEDPAPASGEAVIKVEACGICGTDIHVLHGEFAPTRTYYGHSGDKRAKRK